MKINFVLFFFLFLFLEAQVLGEEKGVMREENKVQSACGLCVLCV